MIRDKNKGITITYNYMNLPTTMTWTDGRKLELLYSGAGAKLRMTTYNASGQVTEARDYVGGFEYLQNASPLLQQFPMSEGRVKPAGSGTTLDYEYYCKDHLGNVRLTFMKGTNGLASKQQEDLYYPFGLRQSLYLSGTGTKELYNGKELVDKYNLNWYDYGARYYDPQLGRWHVMDPGNEYHSPYVYVGDYPIIAIDPNGKETYLVIGAGNDPGKWGYANNIMRALVKAGITDVKQVPSTFGQVSDIMYSIGMSVEPKNGIDLDLRSQMVVEAVKKDIISGNITDGEQINLMGYSYGSVVTAHAALDLANHGTTVDNLILVGSTILE
ncbi:MAG: hypothetical protein HYR67_13830 [Bacteroidetes bacterium]|nr:hypothetical protein [Bacteroidota bacterium]